MLALTGDDAATESTLPFPFRYYGQEYTTAFVSTNGHVNFLALSTSLANVSLPATGTPNAAIYGFWDDLFVDDGDVRTESSARLRIGGSWSSGGTSASSATRRGGSTSTSCCTRTARS